MSLNGSVSRLPINISESEDLIDNNCKMGDTV